MNTQAADQIGMGLSILCAIHCLMTPVLVVLFPALGLLEGPVEFHFLIAPFIVLVGSLAFWRGYRRHMRQKILISGCVGLTLVGVSLLITDGAHHHIETTALTAIGSLILIVTHWRNIQLCRCQTCQN